jgi:hypothetical protein
MSDEDSRLISNGGLEDLRDAFLQPQYFSNMNQKTA